MLIASIPFSINGSSVPPKDPDAFIESGYQQIEKFSWEKAAAEYINLYREVIAL